MNKIAKTKYPKQTIYRIGSYLNRYWKQFVFATISASLFGIFAASPSYVVQHIVDEVFVKRHAYLLLPFIACFIGLFALKGVFMYLSIYYMNWVGNRMVNDIRHDLFDKIIFFPTSFFAKRTTGQLMSHFFNDIIMIQNPASSTIRNGVRGLFEAVFLLCVAFIQSWKLSLLMFIVGPLIAISIRRMGSAVRITSRVAQNKMGNLSSLLQELFIGIREIKACNTEKTEVNRFSRYLHRYFTSLMRCIHFESLTPALIEIIAMFGIGLVLYIAALQVLNGTMTPGQLTSFFSAVGLAYQPLKRLITVYADIQYGLAAADRVFEVIDQKFPALKQRTQILPSFHNNICFDNVSFAYNKNQSVLENINIVIKKGESIGIIGSSGAGKSTLCDLLLGFLSPTSGTILIDGHNITKLTFESLRQHIGYVSQQPFLFNDTIQANVAYSQSDATKQQIELACKAAHAHEFIQELPDGYNTIVGENGLNLSGGQKQRLTIARALLKNPPILIFDEATSALDRQSEKMIQLTIDEIRHHKTVITISHRLSLIEKMDRIFTITNRQIFPINHQQLADQTKGLDPTVS
jgi:subfamily B ATP-binding cassette protein MsbA